MTEAHHFHHAVSLLYWCSRIPPIISPHRSDAQRREYKMEIAAYFISAFLRQWWQAWPLSDRTAHWYDECPSRVTLSYCTLISAEASQLASTPSPGHPAQGQGESEQDLGELEDHSLFCTLVKTSKRMSDGTTTARFFVLTGSGNDWSKTTNGSCHLTKKFAKQKQLGESYYYHRRWQCTKYTNTPKQQEKLWFESLFASYRGNYWTPVKHSGGLRPGRWYSPVTTTRKGTLWSLGEGPHSAIPDSK